MDKDELIRDINDKLNLKKNKLKEKLDEHSDLLKRAENTLHDVKSLELSIESLTQIKSHMEKFKHE